MNAIPHLWPSRRVPKIYQALIAFVALGSLVSMPFWVVAIFYPSSYMPGTGWIVIPLVALVTLLGITFNSRGDKFLQRAASAGYAFKLAAAGAAVFLYFQVFSGDMLGYYESARHMLDDWASTGHVVLPTPFWSSGFAQTVSACILAAIGNSLPGEIVVFATLSFWGEYLFYRAAAMAFPEGNRYLMATFLFFLPTIVYWSAPLGKDSLIMFTLGLAFYGFVRLQQKVSGAGWFYLVSGLATTGLVRPHIGGMLAVAFVVPFLIGKNRQGIAGALGRLLGFPVIAAGTAYLVSQAQSFVNADSLQQGMHTIEVLHQGLLYGGSSFGEGSSLPFRLLTAPLLPFRPFPWEAHSLQMIVSSVEGLVLLAIFLVRRRPLMAALREWRTNPAVLALMLFSVEFCLIFAAGVSNFGTLSRMRAMLFPFLTLLVCVVDIPVLRSARRAAPVERIAVGPLHRPVPRGPVQG